MSDKGIHLCCNSDCKKQKQNKFERERLKHYNHTIIFDLLRFKLKVKNRFIERNESFSIGFFSIKASRKWKSQILKSDFKRTVVKDICKID